jgi:8-oxo-dGTP pyrophosphatase MutT (NUDIX family)
MATRIDYYDDPNAPAANSLVPSANVIVLNDRDEILMIRRSDNGNWALPGGAMDLGESLPQCAVREVQEETGITCRITGLVGIYTDPRHVILYTSDGECRQEFSVVFLARAESGTPTPSDESRSVEWVSPEKARGLQMDRSMRLRIDHYLIGAAGPYLG